MIMGKFGTAIRAFFNKLANILWESDPHAILQLEVDQATQQIQVARQGLETYRGLVERVSMQVAAGRQNAQRLESQIKGHLQAGNREVAGQLAIQLQEAKTELAANEQQLTMHTEAYNNNLLKLKQGQKDISAQPAREARRRADRGGRDRARRQRPAPRRDPARGRHGLPAVQPLSAPHRAREHLARAAARARHGAGRGASAAGCSECPRRPSS